VKNKKELKEYLGDDRIISSFEMEQIIRDRKKAGQGVQLKSGMSLIDHYLEGGFQPGELYVISGPTGPNLDHGLYRPVIPAAMVYLRGPGRPIFKPVPHLPHGHDAQGA
jgi:hypothetical protein